MNPRKNRTAPFENQNHHTVVTIPEKLPLSNAEKSVLSKGLNFVPISKKSNKFTTRQDVKKFLCCVQFPLPLISFKCDKNLGVEQNNTDASKPVTRHFNLPNHSHHNMTICRLSFTPREHRKPQKFIFQVGTLSPHGVHECLLLH